MNIEQAKKLSLPDILAKLGHQPVQATKGGNELWYRSPFREETQPSFHTSFLGGKWIWNDFGDTGGTVIDFVMRYQGYAQVREALTFLDGLFEPNPALDQATRPFSFQQLSRREAAQDYFSADRQLAFLSAGPIQSLAILNYLTRERCLPAELVQQYLQEVRYRNLSNGKEYFAFGMPNQAGGYEIRVASSRYPFKSALNARDITLIRGSDAPSKQVSVFEGMTDFLSLLALEGRKNLSGDAIIMHSVSSYQKTVEILSAGQYEAILTYLDNNRAGREGAGRFKTDFGDRVLSQSESFASHVDLNDALRATHQKK